MTKGAGRLERRHAVGVSVIKIFEPVTGSRFRNALLVGAATVAATMVVLTAPALGFVALAGGLLFAAVVLHPPVAAYVLIASTPLIVGIDRSSLVPVLRPNEAVLLLVAGALLVRGLIALWAGIPWRPQLTSVDAVLLGLIVTSSVLPLLWEAVRMQAITSDDLLYSLTLWKYYVLFVLIRASVRSEDNVRRCLWISMWAASAVAVIAVLQSLKLFGIPHLLASYYAPFGTTTGLDINRGTTTLASAIATGDVMAFNLAISLTLLARGARHRGVLIALSALFTFGGLAAGEFSAVIALVAVVVTVGAVTGTLTRKLLAMIGMGSVAALALQPVIASRLHNFSGGIPSGWTDRLANLRRYFWPTLFHHYHFVLGVRPTPRIASRHFRTGYVWIESGHTWLLWTGGIPLFVAFVVFVWVTLKGTLRTSKQHNDATGAAALAAFAALVVMTILMTFDPHLTLRGSADLLFALLALQCARVTGDSEEAPAPARVTAAPLAIQG